jgi:hypothetical protein
VHPYKQAFVSCSILVIQYKEYLWCIIIYEIIVVLLRTLRFPDMKTCEVTEELGGWLYYEYVCWLLRLVQPRIRKIQNDGMCLVQLFVTGQLSNYSNKHTWLALIPLEVLVFAYFLCM